ncbi:MAG: FAD-binding protein [Devosia sp.]
MTEPLSNWAGNLTYAAAAIHAPRSIAEVQAIVRQARKVRALGSRHSFNAIADTDADLISLRHLNRVIAIDAAARTVTIDGGITYGELAPVLDAAGFALENLASLPHISVVGAVSTGTHGSGVGNRNLGAAVASLTFVDATGELLTLSRGDPDFDGAVVALGALGIVVTATLDIVPRFEMRQDVYVGLSFAALAENFEAVAGSAYSVSAFTHWHGDSVEMVWVKSRADAAPPPAELFGARPAGRPLHPISSLDPAPATEQLGVTGPWHERLPHFRMAFLPSVGAELQSEYFVPRADAAEALRALHAIQHRIAPVLLVSEVRTIAADSQWLSMCSGRDSLAFHFTFKPDWPAVSQVLPHVEAALAGFGVRPHWGKLFTMPARAVQGLYPRLGDFRTLLRRHDPAGKFRNGFIDTFIG